MASLTRGDIVLVRLDPTKGSEQRGTRPALVVQNDVGNRNSNTTIIAPLTTSYEPGNIAPYEAEVKASTSDIKEDSVALLNQLRTVSIEHRILNNFGSVPEETMQEVDRAIRVSLGL
ncbi:type II toxin-antitoxin system PemK/MazF family toxin [Halomarina rubra]|uniref:type II toxin-antitoxin system PemK/MazF family toxin n=1 Tax=Halomarina rubra TaxID=2071873 RepID=UPI002032C96B